MCVSICLEPAKNINRHLVEARKAEGLEKRVAGERSRSLVISLGSGG